ncbi:MAG: hypothetical protein AB7K37_13095 [Cyclobacteriaceae bacterium]
MTKVVERKLGRYRAYGLIPEPLTRRSRIEIDPRQSPKSYLNTLIHEKLHILFPEWSEHKVTQTANKLAKFLWDNKYRRIIE